MKNWTANISSTNLRDQYGLHGGALEVFEHNKFSTENYEFCSAKFLNGLQ